MFCVSKMNKVYNTDSTSNDTSNMGTSEGIVCIGAIRPVAISPFTVHTNFVPHEEKSENFIRVDFKRWQQKMLFYLTIQNLTKFLSEDASAIQEEENNSALLIALDAWKHLDFLSQSYILNGFDNTLYNVYSSKKSAKELWESFEKKYKVEDAGTNKFIVGKFLDYKMVDSKSSVKYRLVYQIWIYRLLFQNAIMLEIP